MKTIITLLAFAVLPSLVFAQNAKKKKGKVQESVQQDQAPKKKSVAATMYETASKNGDFEVARAALYYMLAENPENYHLKDSLARIYLAQGFYFLADKMASEVLEKEPDNQQVMEIKAISLQAMGNLKESVDYYEKLFNNGERIQHGYQLAVLQYNLQRYGECNATADFIIKSPNGAEEKVYLNYGENKGQEVSLKAACHNLKGVMFKDLQKTEEAKQQFEAAVQAMPDFVLAIENLKSLNSFTQPEIDK
ncbi:MAG: tetratricopeptide repeat protein [Bacteroidia bacterium]|nr:tetratricopeptide repeat protein [Bacteroidia bacterium]